MTDLAHELTEHTAALRRLARGLVGDGDADDLVQDTVLQALQSPAASPRSWGAWLAGVLRLRARQHRRTEVRRQRREQEQAAARDFTEPTADRVVEHGETLRQLVDAVLALPQPYRETVLLRYQRDLSPTEIATRTRVPLATVKSRLQRGLAMLRERLDAAARPKGQDWRGALAIAFGVGHASKPAAAGVAITTGVLWMGAKLKLAFGGLLASLALVIAMVWRGDWEPGRVPPLDLANGGSNLVAADLRDPGTLADTPLRVESTPIAAASEFAIVHGRCVDIAGNPLPGCEVGVRAVPGDPLRVAQWRMDHGEFVGRDPSPVVSGENGQFVLHVPPTGPLRAEITITGERAERRGGWTTLRAGEVHDLGDVVMRRRVQVKLRVVDVAGDPWPETGMMFSQYGPVIGRASRFLPRTVYTDAQGRAEVSLVEGPQIVASNTVDAVMTNSLDVPGASPDWETVIVLGGPRPVQTIRGRAIDELGAPVASTRIWTASENGKDEVFCGGADADGRFVLGRPKMVTGTPLFVIGTAPDHDAGRTPNLVPWGTDDVTLVLSRGISVEFRVHDAPSGNPVETFAITLRPRQLHQHDRFAANGSHATGAVLWEGLPRGEYELTVEPEDPAFCGVYLRRIHLAGPGPLVHDVALARAASRRLRVSTDDGRPVAGAQFEILDNRKRDEAEPPDVTTLALSFEQSLTLAGDNQVLCWRKGSTDADGTAELRGPAGEFVAVRITGAGNLPLVVAGVDLGDARELAVTVRQGNQLRGRLGPAAFLAAMQEASRVRERLPRRPNDAAFYVDFRQVGARLGAQRFTASVAADGTFGWDGLPAGDWQWTIGATTAGGFLRHELGVFCSTATTEIRTFDLDHLSPSHVQGTVTVNNAPTGGVLTIRGTSSMKQMEDVSVGTDGHFASWVAPGTIRIMFVPTASGNVSLHAESWQVPPGQQLDRSVALQVGTLQLTFVDDQGQPVDGLGVSLLDAAGKPREWLEADHRGRIVRALEVGTFTLRCRPRSLQGEAARTRFQEQNRDVPGALDAQWITIASVVVGTGDGEPRRIVLPPDWHR